MTPTLSVGPLIQGAVYAPNAIEAFDMIQRGIPTWVDDEETAETVLRAMELSEDQIAWRMR